MEDRQNKTAETSCCAPRTTSACGCGTVQRSAPASNRGCCCGDSCECGEQCPCPGGCGCKG